MHIEHAVRGTIHASPARVWALVGTFADQSWNPGIKDCHLVDDRVAGIGAIRRMQGTDGSIIFERLDELRPGRALTYSFAGCPPGPVLTSRTTVTVTGSPRAAGEATEITWSGVFDVVGDDERRTVEHLNRDIVWPALIGGLAASLGVGHALNTPG